eukprot:TRINITY_DN13936_c0_g1_i1.p1 TRINITY_DN13936_c0_g1~~TRINITY_DN13936_c0_g1_i1.p1  ORF type:complete len:523 (-),score=134.78 TRINITY_DN13936_c0_g1_i1:152-1720(-)
MIRRPPRSTLSSSSAASDVYKRQGLNKIRELIQLPPRPITITADDAITTSSDAAAEDEVLQNEAGVVSEEAQDDVEVADVAPESESDQVSKVDEEVTPKPTKSTVSSEHNSSTPASKKGKKRNKKNRKSQSGNTSCSNSVAKSCTPSVSVPPSLCDEDEEQLVDNVDAVVPVHRRASSSDIEQDQEVVDSHEMDHDATPATEQNEKEEEHVEDEEYEEEHDANACEHDVTREYYEGDEDEGQYTYTTDAIHEEEEEQPEEKLVEEEEEDEQDQAVEEEQSVPADNDEVVEEVEEEEEQHNMDTTSDEKVAPTKNTKNEVSFTPSPSDDGGDSVPYLLSGMRQDSSVEIQPGMGGGGGGDVTSSWAAVAQHPPTPEDRTSDRMSPDSNRYMTCATEEAQTPPEANTPEFMSRFDAGDSLGSNQGSLIGRGMRPVSEVNTTSAVVDVIEEDDGVQASSLPSLAPPSPSPGDGNIDDSSSGDEVATKAHQSTSSASALKTSATSSPPLSSQNTCLLYTSPSPRDS